MDPEIISNAHSVCLLAILLKNPFLMAELVKHTSLKAQRIQAVLCFMSNDFISFWRRTLNKDVGRYKSFWFDLKLQYINF